MTLFPWSSSVVYLADPIPTPVEAAAGAQAVNRSSVAALCFLVWDICITMQDEVQLMWFKPLSLTKILYFYVRYVPMLVQASLLVVGTELSPQFNFTFHDCFIWQVFQGVASVTIIAAVDFILILRVYALYHARPNFRIVVGILFIVELVCMVVGLVLALPGVRYDDICAVTGVPSSLLVYAFGSILFQIFLFGLTAYQFFVAVRSGWGNVPLIELLMRDGTWAFGLLFAVVVAESCLYALSNHAYAGVLFGWLLTTFSFVGYHVLLNLQRLPRGNSNSQATTSRTRSGLQFSTLPWSDPESDFVGSLELSPLSSTVVTSSSSRTPHLHMA
ncbi:hypothetical protein HGRIS_002169 [Hohenbuehelia grisea]|uniref:DUF6533 domain-containing protein n=1 Tax=Hohenbuehelia grisea TaxID=104357 RepID=A0ABR3JJW9_9AGAR